jgi:hypothetical protein
MSQPIILMICCAFGFNRCITADQDKPELFADELQKNLHWIVHQLGLMNEQLAEIKAGQSSLDQRLKTYEARLTLKQRLQSETPENQKKQSKVVIPNLPPPAPRAHSTVSTPQNAFREIKQAWEQENHKRVIFYFGRFGSFIRIANRQNYLAALEWTIKSYLALNETDVAQRELTNQTVHLSSKERDSFEELFHEKP